MSGHELWKVSLWEGVTSVLKEVREVLYNAQHNKVLTLPRDVNCHCNTTNNTTILCSTHETPGMAFRFSQ